MMDAPEDLMRINGWLTDTVALSIRLGKSYASFGSRG